MQSAKVRSAGLPRAMLSRNASLSIQSSASPRSSTRRGTYDSRLSTPAICNRTEIITSRGRVWIGLGSLLSVLAVALAFIGHRRPGLTERDTIVLAEFAYCPGEKLPHVSRLRRLASVRAKLRWWGRSVRSGTIVPHRAKRRIRLGSLSRRALDSQSSRSQFVSDPRLQLRDLDSPNDYARAGATHRDLAD